GRSDMGAAARAGNSVAVSGFVSGTYSAVVVNAGMTYQSSWGITVTGSAISGTSYWDCCPGPHTDPLSGSVSGNQVTIVRHCGGQGTPADCLQTFVGVVDAQGGVTGTINGSFVHPPATFTLTPSSAPATGKSCSSGSGFRVGPAAPTAARAN